MKFLVGCSAVGSGEGRDSERSKEIYTRRKRIRWWWVISIEGSDSNSSTTI